ncbi:MAG: response regulator transcription factor [Cytophagales bacterium]
MQKTIVIVEDNETLIKSLVYSIEETQNYKVLNTYLSGEDAVSNISQNVPDLIIMDIQLSGSMNGIECTSILKKRFPAVDILMLTVFDDSDQVFDALRAGACGYMTKNTSVNELIAALDQAAIGGAPMSFKIARMVLNSFTKNYNTPLTDKEDEVLNILAKGGSYKTAANTMDVSVETVKYHIKNIYVKLQVNSKEEAIEYARKNKWI